VPLHFGLGEARKVDAVEITWPDGERQVLRDLEARRTYRVAARRGAAGDGAHRRHARSRRDYDAGQSMIPISDDNTGRRTTPVMTWALIAANVFIFVFFQGLGTNEKFTLAYATVPYEILTGRDVAQPIPIRDEYGRERGEIDLQPTPIPVFLTLVTSMFLHGGIAHPAREHALPPRLRRQRGGCPRTRALSRLLPSLRGAGRLAHVATAAFLGKGTLVPSPRRLGRDLGRARPGTWSSFRAGACGSSGSTPSWRSRRSFRSACGSSFSS
jgi:hypothetical protein